MSANSLIAFSKMLSSNRFSQLTATVSSFAHVRIASRILATSSALTWRTMFLFVLDEIFLCLQDVFINTFDGDVEGGGGGGIHWGGVSAGPKKEQIQDGR